MNEKSLQEDKEVVQDRKRLLNVGGSRALVLPKSWVDWFTIDDEVIVEALGEDGSLIIRPTRPLPKSAIEKVRTTEEDID